MSILKDRSGINKYSCLKQRKVEHVVRIPWIILEIFHVVETLPQKVLCEYIMIFLETESPIKKYNVQQSYKTAWHSVQHSWENYLHHYLHLLYQQQGTNWRKNKRKKDLQQSNLNFYIIIKKDINILNIFEYVHLS